MLRLYKSLVRPRVEYCISAWNPHYKKDKEIIEKVQRRFTKMINNMEGKSYEERLYCLKLWTLEEQRNRQDLTEIFKMCNGLWRLKLNEFFYPSNSTQLNEHVRTQVLTPQCPHLFNTTTYETTHLLLHVLIYLQFRSGRLCNHTRYPGATKTYLNVL